MSKKRISRLEDHLGYWLRLVSNTVHQRFTERLSGYEISVSQWGALCTLYHEKGLSLKQAVQCIGVDKSALSRMVDRLVEKGLVSRVEGGSRRTIQLDLTAEGRTLVPKLAKLADQNDEDFFSSLDPKKKQALLKMVQQLLAANGWDGSQLNSTF